LRFESVAGTVSGRPLQTPETPAAILTGARRIAANIAKLPGLRAGAFEKLAEQVAPITG